MGLGEVYAVRIMQFCTNYFHGGGIQRHVFDLSDWLVAHDHEVIFAGGAENSTIDPKRDDFIALPMNKVSYRGGNIFSRICWLVAAVRRLRRALNRHRVDIIHAHETAPALVARLATIGKKIPIVMTFHGATPERIQQVAKTARFTSDLIASPSRIVLDSLIANGVDEDKTALFGLGIAPLRASPPDVAADLRKTYLDDDSGIMIFSPSRLAPQKGIDVMIEVVKKVVAGHPQARFIVAGGGELTDLVGGWAEAAGVSDYIRFIGSIDTVPEHLRAADIFLLTSRWEALPISIVEAFRAGVPVIATDCGGVSELVDDTVGELCAVEDVDALANAVIELINSDEVRRRKGEAALARSQSARFDPESVHSHIAEAYGRLLS